MLRRPRLEPDRLKLQTMADAGDIDELLALIRDPESTKGLRRQAALALVSRSPGGEPQQWISPRSDPELLPLFKELLNNEDGRVRRYAASGLRHSRDPGACSP